MTRRSRKRTWPERICLLAGVVGLGLWGWATGSRIIYQDWGNWVYDRETRHEPISIPAYVEARARGLLAHVRERLEARPDFAGLKPNPPAANQPGSGKTATIPDNGIIGRVSIPRLEVSAIVREGTDDATLRVAAGHIKGTALPGEAGNVGLAAHRDTLFRGLRDVRTNDHIIFESLLETQAAGSPSLKRIDYQVESTSIVKPEDVGVLRPGAQREITLVTCYPFSWIGFAPERFIVKAREVPAEALPDQEVSKTDQPVPAPPAVHPSTGNRVFFQVALNHSRTLVPGISIGVTGTDVTSRSMSGWMWVMPDRRTIWLRDQNVNEPLRFYGHDDGKEREVTITSISREMVSGYLTVKR